MHSVTIPVSLPPSRNGVGKGDNSMLVEESFTQSTPSVVVTWGQPQTISSTGDQPDTAGAYGVVVGCRDGSAFVLRSSNGSTTPPNISVSIPPVSSPREPLSPPTSPRRYRGLGHASSRSASPSSAKSALSPFQLTRSRVVSSVSTESAEAPKNYVDFDEEQERLRGMLKGKPIRDRNSSTSRTRADREITQLTATSAGAPRKEDTRGHLTAALSPSSSTLSLSPSNPPSPTFPSGVSPEPAAAYPLSLRFHVFLPFACAGSSVSALKVHEGGRYISCLHTTGGLSVHTTTDGSCIASTFVEAKLKAPLGGKAQPTPSVLWVWRSLLVAASEESTILFACASPDELYPTNQFLDAGTSDSENQSLVVAYELRFGADSEAKLEQLGQWAVDGPLNSIGLRANHDHTLTLFHAGPAGHLVSRSLRINDPLPEPEDLPGAHSSTHLPLPNPFKALKALSTENIPDTESGASPDRIEIGDEVDLGELGLTEPLLGLRAHDGDADARVCAWSAHELLIGTWAHGGLVRMPVIALSGIQEARWIDHDSCSLLFTDRLVVYSIPPSSAEKEIPEMQPLVTQTVPISPYEAATIAPNGHVISTRVKNRRRRIHHTTLNLTGLSAKEDIRTHALWKAQTDASAPPQSAPRVSSVLPIDLDNIVVGYTDGRASRSSLHDVAQKGNAPAAQVSDLALPGPVLAVDVIQNTRTRERVVVGGSDDGTIAVWALETMKLCARWTVFTTPLAQVISLEDEGVGRMHGCMLCISQDGTIAVIAVDGYQFVYLVPASAAPLKRVCLGENNLLLVYADGRARLWDTGTREFWRSMSVEKAEELVQQGGWHQWDIGKPSEKMQALSSPGYSSPDASSTLLLDIPALLKQLSPSPVVSAANLSPKEKLDHARALLSILLTFGISEGIDTICGEGLAIKPSSATIGVASPHTLSIVPQQSSASVWTVSPEASAERALAILALLQFLSQFEDLAQDASTVTTFYAASIGQLVPGHQTPSIPRLAHHMLDTQSPEVRHAVRLLLDAGVARLSDGETAELVETWQQYLPATQPEKERDASQSAKALCICGFVAVEKYSLLPTSTLTDIAKSIAIYLHDETSPHRSLAIDLCSRGFQVWQQYVDAVEMLRALFTLATTTKKEAIAVPNIGVQARTAVMQIAAGNTPLFMTTLALDILHPRSVQHRKSVMQLVVFLIRKKPLVLYGNLPRLVEAIVKSLDPNSSASRDAVLDSATAILSHIVQTFPTVDFHMASQRLAVGTSEGAVVMYDLKTATRLYVLEGHKKRTTACSFSPDGRRLVTMSLEEADVLVWKVGSSFTSLFMPGAPPRQGHGGGEPFKRLEFHIGDAAHMTIEASLVNVQFDWLTDRNVRLKIRDSILTFST